jgi:lipid II:glycine glycyltransferase (peptidoglycan interpeptide bridge formation enzyme)
MPDHSESILLAPGDSRWVDFIHSHPDANIFHHPAWMELMSKCYGYTASVLALANRDGSLRAGLPFMKINTLLTGKRWVSLPFSDYCRPLYHDDTAREELADQLLYTFKSNMLKKMEVRWSLPERPGIYPASEFVLHAIKIGSDPEQISKRFKRTHLQNIRTAEEKGVTVEFGNELKHLIVFYNLQLETRKRHGVPAQPWKYFELLFHHIVKPGLGFVLLAQKDDEYIAGMVYLGWRRTLIAKYAASREDRFNLRSNNLLFWEGIRWGCQHGYEVFDMGRTELEDTGLRNFKSRWGAQEESLTYSTLSSKPLQPANGLPKRMLHSVIQHAPLWFCRLAGELLYKHAG